MKKWIRWPGFGFFAVFVLVLSAFSLLFIDGFVERMLESQGSRLVGARVDLDKADVSFMPLGLTLFGLQVTNPDEPMRNGVEIDRLAMGINSLHLLERKVIIDEMAVQGVRFDTPRQKSGALTKKARPEKHGQEGGTGFKMPQLQMPDVKDVLSRETLETLELARNFEEQLSRDQAQWQQRLADLPDQQKLTGYQARLQKVKSSSGFTGLLTGAAELEAVRKEVKADLDQLKKAQNDFSALSDSYQGKLALLNKAPQQDIKRLLDTYGLSAQGFGNMSGLLFGEKIGGMVRTASSWYAKAQPLLQRRKDKQKSVEVIKPLRGKGVNVRFKEDGALPDFLIRKIDASVVLAAGALSGTISNVTPDQDVLGAPMTLAFAGDKLQGMGSLRLDGVFDHVQTDKVEDSLTLQVRKYEVGKITLSSAEQLPVTLDSALVDLSVGAKLRGRDVNATVLTSITAATFTTAKAAPEGNLLSQALADAVAKVNRVGVKAVITGPVDDYNVVVNSDLDEVMKEAISKSLTKQSGQFEQELKEAVMTKVKGPLAGATTSYGGLDTIADELKKRLQIGGSLLK